MNGSTMDTDRYLSRRRRSVVAVALASLALGAAGCGVHLHRPNDAKQARAATDGFNQLKLDAAIVDARANVAALTAAELETRQKLGQTLVRRDLLSVLTSAPIRASDQSPARGWPKLLKEMGDVLGRYGLVKGDPPVLAESDVTRLRLITRRSENVDNVALERRVYDSMVKTSQVLGNATLLPSECDRLVTAQPPGVSDAQWNHYNDNIRPACKRLESAEGAITAAEQILKRDPAYSALAAEMDGLDTELKKTEEPAKQLAANYEKAKKDLADAQERVAKGPAAAETAEARKQLDEAKADVTNAVKALEAVTDAARKIPLLDAAIKSDLLTEVVANAKFLSGDTKAPAHQVTRTFVNLLERSPDVAGRLKAAGAPSVNVLILELALQRLRYQSLAADRVAMQDLRTILAGKRGAIIEAAAAWGRVMEAVATRPEGARDPRPRLGQESVAAVLAEPRGTDTTSLRDAVSGYVAAKLIEDVDLPAFDVRLGDRYYRMSLDYSEMALQVRNDLIRAPLQEITAYHEGGVKSEEIAQLLQAIGVTTIGAGVLK